MHFNSTKMIFTLLVMIFLSDIMMSLQALSCIHTIMRILIILSLSKHSRIIIFYREPMMDLSSSLISECMKKLKCNLSMANK